VSPVEEELARTGELVDQSSQPHPRSALALGPSERRPQQPEQRGVAVGGIRLALIERRQSNRPPSSEPPLLGFDRPQLGEQSVDARRLDRVDVTLERVTVLGVRPAASHADIMRSGV
jgi:hypothetical protein